MSGDNSKLDHQNSLNEENLRELSPRPMPKNYFEKSHNNDDSQDVDMDGSVQKYIDLNSTLTPFTQERDQNSSRDLNDVRAAIPAAINPNHVLAKSKLSPLNNPQERYTRDNSNFSKKKDSKQISDALPNFVR